MSGAGFGIERFRPVRQEITVGFKMRVELDKALGRTATRTPYYYPSQAVSHAFYTLQSSIHLSLGLCILLLSTAVHCFRNVDVWCLLSSSCCIGDAWRAYISGATSIPLFKSNSAKALHALNLKELCAKSFALVYILTTLCVSSELLSCFVMQSW